MQASPNRSRPSLAAGKIRLGLRCERALSKLLHPDEQTKKFRKPPEGTFRLSNAISVALVDAHRLWEDRGLPIGGLAELLDDMPCPPELGHEEAARYAALLDAYSEQFAAEPLVMHSLAGKPLSTPFGTSEVVAHSRVQLLFSTDNDTAHASSVELRMVFSGSRPREADQTTVLTQLLAIGASEARVVRLYALPGQVDLTVESITEQQLRSFATEVGAMTDSMMGLLSHATPAQHPRADFLDDELPVTTTKGWWCSSCPFIKGCDQVASNRFSDLVRAYPQPEAGSP